MARLPLLALLLTLTIPAFAPGKREANFVH